MAEFDANDAKLIGWRYVHSKRHIMGQMLVGSYQEEQDGEQRVILTHRGDEESLVMKNHEERDVFFKALGINSTYFYHL